MAETMVEESVDVSVLEFAIEADGPRNDDLMIQCIPGIKLRSAITGMRTVKNKQGDDTIPIDQARSLADFPKTPGMRLHVDPAERTYEIIDPLYGDDELCRKVTRWLNNRMMVRTSENISGTAPQKGNLDHHRIKSLCREMLQLVDTGYARCVKGVMPSLEDITELPGDFLLNPGARITNLQPRFEKDWYAWISHLRVGIEIG